jgi:hypothetical protein
MPKTKMQKTKKATWPSTNPSCNSKNPKHDNPLHAKMPNKNTMKS